MTFTIDRTRSFLKVEESNLLSLHRSCQPVAPAADYCQRHLCDAFICVVSEYNLHRVYLALHDQQLKSNLVFISDPIRPDSNKLAALLQEGYEFLENMGFEMKPVAINFSSGTREVIIKDIRVMREPSLPLQLDAAKAALEALAAEKREFALKASREQKELQAELEDLRKRLVAATAAHQAPVIDASVKAGEGEGARLAGVEKELQKVRDELGTVKTTLKSTMETLKNAKDEARQAKKELKLHKQENRVLNEKLQSEQLELERAKSEIEAVRREVREAGKIHESALQERVAQNDASEAAHKAELAGLKAEMKRLTAELAGKDSTRTGEVELLRAAFSEANASLSAEKAKNESALREMDALERNAANQLKILKKKVDALTAEKQLLENTAAEIKIKARGEIERQQQINQTQRKAAIKKLHALKEEIRQLAEARAVIESPIGMPLLQPDKDVPSLPAYDRIEMRVFGQNTGFASEPFGTYEAAENIDFLPDKLLKGIPYSSSSDVVEIYRSYNTIHAAPTGKQPQRCDGFVCLVTEGGLSQVYVAWMMNTTGEVLICLPDLAAGGDDSCRRMMREGIGYFERIGFLMDSFCLEADPDKRQAQLDGLAIFCRAATECAA